jgi:hypothetical protein
MHGCAEVVRAARGFGNVSSGAGGVQKPLRTCLRTAEALTHLTRGKERSVHLRVGNGGEQILHRKGRWASAGERFRR